MIFCVRLISIFFCNTTVYLFQNNLASRSLVKHVVAILLEGIERVLYFGLYSLRGWTLSKKLQITGVDILSFSFVFIFGLEYIGTTYIRLTILDSLCLPIEISY